MPDWMVCTTNLKISKESGFSGVAADMPKLLPTGRETYMLLDMGIIVAVGWSCLVRRETELVVHGDFEDRVRVPETHDRGTTQVTVWVVAVAKSQTVYAPVTVVVCRTVVEESSDAASLDRVSLLLGYTWVRRHTLPPCVSRTSAKPSNWPTV